MGKNALMFLFLGMSICTLRAQDFGAAWIIPPILTGFDTFDFSPKQDDALFVAIKMKRQGVFNVSGKCVVPLEFTDVAVLASGWITAFKDGKHYLFNRKGENMGLPYDNKYVPLGGGDAIVYKDGLCGVINQKGEEIVPVEQDRYVQMENNYVFFKGTIERDYFPPKAKIFENIQRLLERPMPSKLAGYNLISSGERQGLADSNGVIVVPPLYTLGEMHPAGYIVAKLGQNWGVMDAKHKVLRPFTASAMGNWTANGYLPVKETNGWGLLRFPSGEMVIPFGVYDEIEVYDAKKEWFIVTQQKLKGLIDANRAPILPIFYDYIGPSNETTTYLIKNKLWGYWHRPSGSFEQPRYKRVTNTNDSLCIVSAGDTAWALVDVKTKKAILPFSKFQIEKAGPYFILSQKYDPSMGSTASGQLHGLYDRMGKMITPPDSADLFVFPDSTYFVCPHFKESSDSCEHRTPGGKVLRRFSKLVAYINEDYWVQATQLPSGKRQLCYFSYLDPPGQEKWYDIREKVTENLRLVRQDKKYGYTDKAGKVLIPLVFDNARTSKEGYLKVKYQGKWGVLQNPRFNVH